MDEKKIEKLFKRYLKEASIFGSHDARVCINRLRKCKDYYMPFNFFRWDLSRQGHMYWFNHSIEWCLFLYENIGDIENKEDINKQIKSTIRELLDFYISTDYLNKYKETEAYKSLVEQLKTIDGKID